MKSNRLWQLIYHEARILSVCLSFYFVSPLFAKADSMPRRSAEPARSNLSGSNLSGSSLSDSALSNSFQSDASAARQGAWQVYNRLGELKFRWSQSFESFQSAVDGSAVRGTALDTLGTTSFVVPDGLLLGGGTGELKGQTWWISRNGRSRRSIYGSEVEAFIPMDFSLLAFTRGGREKDVQYQLIALTRVDEGVWNASELSVLTAKPLAFSLVSPERLLYLDGERLMELRAPGEIRELHHSLKPWSGFSPNSLAINADGRVCIGMRSYIVCLRPSVSGYTEEWLDEKTLQSLIAR